MAGGLDNFRLFALLHLSIGHDLCVHGSLAEIPPR